VTVFIAFPLDKMVPRSTFLVVVDNGLDDVFFGVVCGSRLYMDVVAVVGFYGVRIDVFRRLRVSDVSVTGIGEGYGLIARLAGCP
jgi:hypothetical protein